MDVAEFGVSVISHEDEIFFAMQSLQNTLHGDVGVRRQKNLKRKDYRRSREPNHLT